MPATSAFLSLRGPSYYWANKKQMLFCAFPQRFEIQPNLKRKRFALFPRPHCERASSSDTLARSSLVKSGLR